MTWRSFKQARKFAREMNLSNKEEWKSLVKSNKIPNDIPTDPQSTYKNKGWTSWGDFLGTGTIASFNRTYSTFTEARKFVRSLGLKSQSEWRNYTKKNKLPSKIPRDPPTVYRKQWKGLGDWLGTGKIGKYTKSNTRPFKEARKFVQSLNLSERRAWIKYCRSGKKPNDIPATPERVYKNKGWVRMGDWLGTGTIAPFNRKYRPFEKARKFAHSLKLESKREWEKFSRSDKKSDDIPSDVRRVYKNKGWKGWGDFLGTGYIAQQNREYLSWFKAKIEYQKLAKKHGLKTYADWIKFSRSHKLPPNLPSQPWHIYTKEKVWKRMKK